MSLLQITPGKPHELNAAERPPHVPRYESITNYMQVPRGECRREAATCAQLQVYYKLRQASLKR